MIMVIVMNMVMILRLGWWRLDDHSDDDSDNDGNDGDDILKIIYDAHAISI